MANQHTHKSPPSLKELEQAGKVETRRQGSLRLAQRNNQALEMYLAGATLSAISDQLGCDPRDLAAMPFKTTRSTDPADIQLLGALLADFGAPVHEATIAAVLGWAPERRDAAETQLRERLQQLGQTVTRSPCGELAVAASAECVSDELRAALRHQALEFDDTSAQVLSLAAHGRVIERLWDELDEPMLAAASELMAAGIVDEHNGRLVLSTALLNALDTRHLDGLGWW